MKKITYFVELLNVIRNNSTKIVDNGLKGFIEKLPEQSTFIRKYSRTRRYSRATLF